MMEITKFPTQGLSQLCDSGKHNVDDEFIHLIPRNTIQGLKDCKEVSLLCFSNLFKWIMYDLSSEVLLVSGKLFCCFSCYKTYCS